MVESSDSGFGSLGGVVVVAEWFQGMKQFFSVSGFCDLVDSLVDYFLFVFCCLCQN